MKLSEEKAQPSHITLLNRKISEYFELPDESDFYHNLSREEAELKIKSYDFEGAFFIAS